MTLFVHVTEQCNADALRCGQIPFLNNLKVSVENNQALPGFSYFLSTPFLKKSLGKSFRLIGYRKPIEDDELILFLRVLPRGDKQYERFLETWETETEYVTRQIQPYTDAQLREIHSECARIAPPQPLPAPNTQEHEWLNSVLKDAPPNDEMLVLETKAWVERIKDKAHNKFLSSYHAVLANMAENINDICVQKTNTDCHVYWDSSQDYGILYIFRPENNRLMLLEPVRRGDSIEALLKKHEKSLAGLGDGNLSRIGARSYPLFMVLDVDAWLKIQEDVEANMALSPEEADLLESIHRAGARSEVRYPLFINGRAGSGKSTMLQYLASDYVDFELRNNTGLLPLYMTCSRALLERGRETVQRLLTTQHARLLAGPHERSRIEPIVSQCFAVFHDFLYSRLSPDVQRELPRERYVNYAEFRRFWARDFAKRPVARSLSADVAWHVIRSYIKGARSSKEDELDPGEFAALPRKRRSVSHTTYKQMYENVWCGWYQRLCSEDHYWDDQDLALRVLESGVASDTSYAAIFCDEAQDFTPIELEIIFQLSVFSRRLLQPEDLQRVPIIFAGDPLQTINPTGFRWDAVQAEFHDRYSAVLDPRRRSRVAFSHRELCFNYRSNRGIVRFCNLIQLVRAALLQAPDIRPQEAWWEDPPEQTVWIELDDARSAKALRERSELVKVVNCEDGQEADYARHDDILKNLNNSEELTGDTYRNVFGTTRAKGLEFPAVVIYRFGQTAPRDFGSVLNGELALEDAEQRLPLEYFLNRLYVAASRAKGSLTIVESDDAFRSFWQLLMNPDMIDRLMDLAGGRDVWRKEIAFPVRGDGNGWTGQRVDPREQAADYANQGRSTQDPYFLRQAALAYRSAGDELEAVRCLAEAAELDGELREAGDKYSHVKLYDEAFRCFWWGRCWKELCNLTAQDPALASRLQSRAADFMVRASGLDVGFLEALASAATNETWLQNAQVDATWRDVFVRIADRASKAVGDAKIPWPKLNSSFRSLSGAGVAIADAHLAAIAFGAGDFASAVSLWEKGGVTDKVEYNRAKARVAPFPQSLVPLSRLKEYGEILKQWHDNEPDPTTHDRLDDQVLEAVADAALNESDLSLAATLLTVRPDRERVARLLRAAVQSNEKQTVVTAAIATSRLLVRTRDWKAAIRAAEDGEFAELSGTRASEVREALAGTDGMARILSAVLQELAVSRDLPAETSDRQAPVTEFLRRRFIETAGTKQPEHGIPPQVVGAAIERAGRIVDALRYYEDVEKNASTAELQRFAAERRVRNLERYAEYFRKRNDEASARQRDSMALQIRSRIGIGNRTLADYPVVDSRRFGAGPTDWQHTPLKFVLSRELRLLRIEHIVRFETVTVDPAKREVRGDARVTKSPPSSSGSSSWRVEEWDTTITMFHNEAGKISIQCGEQSYEVPMV